jgi:hypothetical protein
MKMLGSVQGSRHVGQQRWRRIGGLDDTSFIGEISMGEVKVEVEGRAEGHGGALVAGALHVWRRWIALRDFWIDMGKKRDHVCITTWVAAGIWIGCCA